LSIEERIGRLEEQLKAQAVREGDLREALAEQERKLAEIEKVAKKKGGMMQLVTQYGAPFALWYGACWAGMWFSLYVLLEAGLVSWQETLQPLFESLGLDSYVERVDPSTGNVVIAFLVNELIEPVRFPLVLATGLPVIRAVKRLRGA